MQWLTRWRHHRQRRRCREAGHPDYICTYLDQGQYLPALRTPWEQLRFVVLDTETTGLDPTQDRILSIGAVAVTAEAMVLADSLELFVRNEPQHEAEAIAVHGIIPDELATGLPEGEALAALLAFLRADVIVAHHAAFDLAMIEQAARRQGVRGFRLHNRRIDTARLAQKIEKPHQSAEYINHRDYTLDALTERYDISRADRHTAWGDAYITALLLLKLMRELRERHQLELGSLL